MNNRDKYRHEFKYFISDQEIEILKNRLTTITHLDNYAKQIGRYTIRSLYYDSCFNQCYYENENGTDPREKFRVRIYNGSFDRIMLECKRKEHGKTLKKANVITLEQCERLMYGLHPKEVNKEQPVLYKLMTLMSTELYRPKVIVEYDRIPYVYRLGNVRITFDKCIRSSTSVCSFFEKNIPTRPILPTGYHILEVKYDDFIPDYIKSIMEIGSLTQTAFSKYYLCRKYNYGGLL